MDLPIKDGVSSYTSEISWHNIEIKILDIVII